MEGIAAEAYDTDSTVDLQSLSPKDSSFQERDYQFLFGDNDSDGEYDDLGEKKVDKDGYLLGGT